ncbi:MAG: hypothetical protein ABIU54_04160, partial [Candidatus Eisenbacteria bacterium]
MRTLLALRILLSACSPAQRAIVTEVYYDAIGDDTGHEYVEFYNPTALPVPMQGVRLEAGDGSAPGRWTLRWTGAAGDTVRPLGRFVVGGAKVVPAPDALATLELQNGPDAMRVLWPDGGTEVVGWGAHALVEYYCGEPAPDAPSGQALARVPDDAQTGANATDFRIAEPSPGRANQVARDLAVRAHSLGLTPEQPAAGATVTLRGWLEARGRTRVGEGEARLFLESDLLDAPLEQAVRAIEAGDSLRATVTLPGLRAGTGILRARVSFVGDEQPGNDADSLRVRVGTGPLTLTELQFHPARGEGEWVEVRNTSGGPLALEGYNLTDRSGTRGKAAGGTLQPDSLAVFAQDRSALLLAFPAIDSARVRGLSPWPSLNNSDDDAGVADAVVLREPDGLRSDALAYSASGVGSGAPLELTEGIWRAADAPGTPLHPPRPPTPPGAVAFALAATRVHIGTPLAVRWSLPWRDAR